MAINSQIAIRHIGRSGIELSSIWRCIPQVSARSLIPIFGGIFAILYVLELCFGYPVITLIYLERQRISIPLIVYVHNAAAIGGNGSAIGMVILEASIALIIHLGYNSTRCSGLRNGRIIAVIVVIGVFKPVLNKIVNPVIDFPLCSKCDIICRHSCRHALIPTSESITRLSRRAERYRRAVTGIDGFYAVAAVKIQAEHIIVAVILYLNYRAAISRYINIGIVVKRREATIFLFQVS